eukprot:357321-Chlamydomonas_euryale.AAC.5
MHTIPIHPQHAHHPNPPSTTRTLHSPTSVACTIARTASSRRGGTTPSSARLAAYGRPSARRRACA